MNFKYIIFLCVTLLLFNSCSKDKQNEEKRKKEVYKRDSISTSEYFIGIERFGNQNYNLAKYSFQSVDSLNKYFNKSQEYLRVINDTIQVIRKNTLKLIDQIDVFLKHNKQIDDRLLYDSLISQGILDEDYIIELYRDEIEEAYKENNPEPMDYEPDSDY